MLKRLELVGFKSFADKTHFDFPAGITAVVGPNGSGKSNIVDSVRWILGEQSAKSLRGGEMADVIFNGSTSRRSLGLAEVTMTFDNSRHLLATEATEVQITRRVYRSSEGEYLINHQPCRLKDIKDLFLGSGAGSDAYCIIEQGRVDVLLQSSTRDRRTIFEEAAGISRFKARKTETLRKLERVDQNLQRLRDIIDEVEKQLRSVKLQAAKAQRYQEYHDRLKQLRVGLGLDEYHLLTSRLEEETAVLNSLRTGLNAKASQADAWEAGTRRLEETLAGLDEAVHQQETLLATARRRIAAEETTQNHEWALAGELEADLAATRARMTELNARVGGLALAVSEAAGELHGAEMQTQEHRAMVRTLEKSLEAVGARLAGLNNQKQADEAEHLEQMRQVSRLQNDAVSKKGQVDGLRRERERLRQRSEQAEVHLASLDLELQELIQAEESLQGRLGNARQAMIDHRQERDRLRQLRDQTIQTIADLRAQQSGLASRIEVLERLERSHEGLGTGVREVFSLLDKGDAIPWGTVVGMVADFLTVGHEYAPLIDLALGERAQRFLIRDPDQLAVALQQREQPFSGRVSFLPFTRLAPGSLRHSEVSLPGQIRTPRSPEGTPAHLGVVALAEHLVTCENPELADLPAQLLGRTLIVRDLATARAIASSTRGYRLITLQGELLEPDGTLTAGTYRGETGILSRKSELRELRQERVDLDHRITETDRDLADLRDRVSLLDSETGSLQQEIDVLNEQAADMRSRVNQHRQRREGLHEEVATSRSEISGIEREIDQLQEDWQLARTQAETAEQQVHLLKVRIDDIRREIREKEQASQIQQQEVTAAKVALAKVEERLTGLRAKHHQIETDLEQRRQERVQGEQHLAGARNRLEESQRTMLQASAALARWYLDKEAAERQLVELVRERELQRQERHLLAEQSQAARAEWRNFQDQAHALELAVNDLRHRRDSLIGRLHEDYLIDLAQLYERSKESGVGSQEEEKEPPGIPQGEPSGNSTTWIPGQRTPKDKEAADQEIEELRRKLSRLGSVNLDSLQELAELENRAGVLQSQYQDLVTAKRSLDEIIGTINQDSRRLFTETFATIRIHFQELFRKLFGGGMADIVLENEADILESGIEIIARPPGKELRSISLMSGGEKTLTAVALLLAIFRSKPSPFCILDEVDAALDEANIGRYTTVLREFLDQSQFIIITHSKRTMAAADVLYGITMQESGVSKQVAVRFEDWPDDEPANGEPTNGTAGQTEARFAGR